MTQRHIIRKVPRTTRPPVTMPSDSSSSSFIARWQACPKSKADTLLLAETSARSIPTEAAKASTSWSCSEIVRSSARRYDAGTVTSCATPLNDGVKGDLRVIFLGIGIAAPGIRPIAKIHAIAARSVGRKNVLQLASVGVRQVPRKRKWSW